MKKKLIAAALLSASLAFPAAADPLPVPEKPADFETLWEMYLELLDDYNALQALDDEEPATDEAEEEGFSYEYEGRKLIYQKCGYTKAQSGPIVFLFFRFENDSKGTTSAHSSFNLTLFQDGVEQSAVMPWYTPEEYGNARTDLRPGKSIDVAFAFYGDPEGGPVELDIDKRAIVIFGKKTLKTFTIDISHAEELELE